MIARLEGYIMEMAIPQSFVFKIPLLVLVVMAGQRIVRCAFVDMDRVFYHRLVSMSSYRSMVFPYHCDHALRVRSVYTVHNLRKEGLVIDGVVGLWICTIATR